ncbi:hypothetical protein DL766_000038 [Monosporascus sp. MC13-8B]|uniref:PAC domain-containing protein n=1 Tax=Monosporascus cannonballus TaxID=155416 RepID=A0ABY0HJB4_9PEZI|nr:hypothetical protein DL762_000407 [Monosporascus cannonballus]RYP01189.1 hypothetical protein DL763_000314 [Monosporascus cannonballus]RYP40237.1 hypothetical protein DL766_000038 [Monosporascus sp. MC13-8B]
MSDSAESDAPSPGAGEIIKLHPDADISITVYEVPQKTSATFQVVRELLRSQSEKFKVLLDPETPFNGGQKQTWTLKEDTGATTRTLELLLRCMLAGDRDAKTGLPQSLYKLPVIEVWRVLTLVNIKAQGCVMAGKYLVSSDVIKGWFLGWFEKKHPNLKNQREFEELLFPTTGQLDESCPFIDKDTGSRGCHHHMHMPKRVIAQLRKARAGTRTYLENGIYVLYKTFINQPNDPCHMSGLACYLEALEATEAYSFEEHQMDRRRSIASIPTGHSPLAAVPSLRSITPSPTSQTSRHHPFRSDRLCLRLRSNSGLTFHTNEAVLDRYINYPDSGYTQSFTSNSPAQSEVLHEDDASDVTESFLASPHGDGAWSADDPWSRLPFMDFMGQDAFQMALDNPAISRQLSEYCKSQGCEEDVEFLMKIQEYNQATDDVAAALTAISTSFTSATAKNPLNLPPTLSGQLNADIRRIAHSILPRMESVFYDATRHVRRRIARDAFPGFVQRQFTYCISLVLSSGTWGIGSPKLEYPGLGESFCISAASSPDFAIAAASDAFAAITGHPLSEIISRNCSSMQGPSTDTATVGRIQRGLQEAREVTELILSYRRDGEPFWNLFSLFPLKDHQGQLHYWLWAQIDVSESVTSRRDLLRVLNRGHNPDVPAEADSLCESTASSAKTVHGERPLDGADSVMSRDGPTRSTSRTTFLQQFRMMQCSPSPPPPATEQYHLAASPSGCSTRRSSDETLPRAGPSLNPPVYSHYFVLACEQFAPSSIIERQPTPTPTAGSRKRESLKLKIAFYSEATAELLSIRGDATGLGIFQFLEQQGRSPSITKSLKSLVRERIEFGKPVGVEILVDSGRSGLFSSRKQNRHASNRPGTSADADHVRSGSAEKLERKTTRVSKQEKLMTHWTPLKDAKGDVEWVVLILAPRMTT